MSSLLDSFMSVFRERMQYNDREDLIDYADGVINAHVTSVQPVMDGATHVADDYTLDVNGDTFFVRYFLPRAEIKALVKLKSTTEGLKPCYDIRPLEGITPGLAREIGEMLEEAWCNECAPDLNDDGEDDED